MSRVWHEADHPRDPANGEFVDKQGWAGRVATAIFGSHRKSEGRELRTKLDYEHLASILPDQNSVTEYSDPALHDIVRDQGFDGLPEVLPAEEMDRRVAAGWTETWRGVRGYTQWEPDPIHAMRNPISVGKVSSAQAAESFRTGEYFAGKGVFGNGTYAAREQDGALGYADYNNGGLLRIAIRPDARVVDFDQLLTLAEKHKSAHWATGFMVRGFKSRQAQQEVAAATGTLADLGAEKAATETVQRRLANKSKVLADPGRLAAAMGYDVIAIQPRNQKFRDGRIMYHVILNRTAVAVQQAEP